MPSSKAGKVVGLIVTAFIFGLTYLIAGSLFADNTQTRLITESVAFGSEGVYLLLVSRMLKKQKLEEEQQGDPDDSTEEVELRTPLHKIVLAWSVFCLLIAGAMLLCTLWMTFNFRDLDFSIPGAKALSGSDDVPMHTISVWWIPIPVGLVYFYLAIDKWQDWVHRRLIITSERLIDARDIIPYLPWKGPVFNQTPFELIVDVDDNAGSLGNILGYGNVRVTKRLQEGSDTETVVVYKYVPNYQEFAETLRGALRDFKRGPQDAVAPTAQEIADLDRTLRALTQLRGITPPPAEPATPAPELDPQQTLSAPTRSPNDEV